MNNRLYIVISLLLYTCYCQTGIYDYPITMQYNVYTNEELVEQNSFESYIIQYLSNGKILDQRLCIPEILFSNRFDHYFTLELVMPRIYYEQLGLAISNSILTLNLYTLADLKAYIGNPMIILYNVDCGDDNCTFSGNYEHVVYNYNISGVISETFQCINTGNTVLELSRKESYTNG